MAKNKTETGTALVNWDAQLAQEAEIAARDEQVASGGQMISTRGGQLSFGGNPIAGNELDVIVIDHIYANSFYEGRFDPENPESPGCYAFARKEVDLAPHEQSESPQSEQCEGCPQNEWGSADTGKGKACKNSRRLALIAADQLDEIADANVAYLSVPVTSTKAWANYVQQLAIATKRPPYAIITKVRLVPDAGTQFKLTFTTVSTIPTAQLAAVSARRAIELERTMFPYPKNSEREERVAKKPPAKKIKRKF